MYFLLFRTPRQDPTGNVCTVRVRSPSSQRSSIAYGNRENNKWLATFSKITHQNYTRKLKASNSNKTSCCETKSEVPNKFTKARHVTQTGTKTSIRKPSNALCDFYE